MVANFGRTDIVMNSKRKWRVGMGPFPFEEEDADIINGKANHYYFARSLFLTLP
jgi:hypothetical protein